MSVRGGSRGSLPTISNPQLSYSQRYEHMTKLANYGEMNQTQIWKQYEKLRACLKELNEQVLRHMEKKAFTNLGNREKSVPTKDQEGTLILLEDEKKANDTRLQTYTNQLNRHEERIKFLVSKPNLLDDLNKEGQQLQNRIKQVRKDNRDLYRNAELQGRDLVNNNSMLDRLMIEEQKLTRVFNQHKKHQQHMKILTEKTERFKEKVVELQKAIDLRVEQFSRQENLIAEQIHVERYQELKKQRDAIGKYQPIYKRNYLMKLKELQTLVNSINKHQKIIQQNEANIINFRIQIEAIGSLVGAQRKRYHSSLLSRKQQKVSQTLPEISANQTLPIIPATVEIAQPVSINDKNQPKLGDRSF